MGAGSSRQWDQQVQRSWCGKELGVPKEQEDSRVAEMKCDDIGRVGTARSYSDL